MIEDINNIFLHTSDIAFCEISLALLVMTKYNI